MNEITRPDRLGTRTRLMAGRGRFEIRAKGKDAEILLYDQIGPGGVTAGQFVAELDKIAGVARINVRVNSPGGDVFAALAIFNALTRHGAKITAHVDGLAASAASLVVMAGSQIRMAESAFMMIHNPWAVALGDANDLRKTADTLDKVGAGFVDVYASRTGNTRQAVAAWLDAEKWFNAQEAKAAGFADVIDGAPSEAVAANFDLSVYAHVPERLRIAATARGEPRNPAKTAEDALRGAGFSQREAKVIVSKGVRGVLDNAGAYDAELVRKMQALAREMKIGMGPPKPKAKRAGHSEPTL